MDNVEELIEFLKEYTGFFERLEAKQQEKLEKLATKELSQIEETIVMQQAMDKQLENMERKRTELFAKMDLSGATFKDVIDRLSGEDKQTVIALYARMGEAVDNIKFINQKAVKLAQTELSRMGVGTSGLVTDPSGIYKPGAGQRKNLFEKKI